MFTEIKNAPKCRVPTSNQVNACCSIQTESTPYYMTTKACKKIRVISSELSHLREYELPKTLLQLKYIQYWTEHGGI